jgi:hypothetical protein
VDGLRAVPALSQALFRRVGANAQRLKMLQARGFRNLRNWTHGVDMHLFRYHEVPHVYADAGPSGAPGIALCRSRVVREEYRGLFSNSIYREPKSCVVWARWKQACANAIRMCAGWACCRAMCWPRCMQRPMFLSCPVARNLWAGDAGSHGNWHAGGGLPGGWTTGSSGDTTGRWCAGRRPGSRLVCGAWRYPAMWPGSAPDFGWGHASQLFVSHLAPARSGSLLDAHPCFTGTVTQLSPNS